MNEATVSQSGEGEAVVTIKVKRADGSREEIEVKGRVEKLEAARETGVPHG